jgi:tetratricopeptide (TPR) repeat protein
MPSGPGERYDFFLSRRGSVAAIAQEVTDVLKENGYKVRTQDYDIPITANFIEEMHEAVKNARDLVVLFTRDYEQSPYTRMEFTSFEANAAQSAEKRRMVILRCEDAPLLGLFAPHVYQDLVGIRGAEERRNRILAAAEGRSQALEPPPRPFIGVPPRIASFTGRTGELDRLDAILMRDKPAAVTQTSVGRAALQGMGGVGKTALAVEYAHRYRSLYAGICWCPAETRTGLLSALAGLAVTVGAVRADEASVEKAAKAALDRLAGQRATWLLIYDNVTSPDEIANLLPSAGARVLITSRFSDWGDWADEVTVDVLPPEEAVAFLQDRTGRNDLLGAKTLAKALDHLPLALDHAAAYCKRTQMRFVEYATKASSLIATVPRGAGYPRSVEATFEVAISQTVAQCPSAEALMVFLAQCAPERIPMLLVEGAIDDEGERLEALEALALVSLVKHDPFDDRAEAVTVHRLVQAIARSRAEAKGMKQAAADRVAARLAAIYPNNVDNPTSWPLCARLTPHVLARAHVDLYGPLKSADWPQLLERAGRYFSGRAAYAHAEWLVRHALAIRLETLGVEHVDTSVSLHNLATLLRAQGDFAGARPLFERALMICEKVLGAEHPHTASCIDSLAGLLMDQNDVAVARPLLERALAIREKAFGPLHPQTARSLNSLGNLLLEQGDLARARTLFGDAMVICDKMLGGEHPTTMAIVNNFGLVLQKQGDLAGAKKFFELILHGREMMLGPEHPDTAESLCDLALLLREQGDLAGARGLLERALTIYDNVLPTSPVTANTLNRLANVLKHQGDLAGARPLSERALAIREKVLGPEHTATATSLNDLAILLNDQGDLAGARPLCERALAIRERASGPEHPDTANSLYNLAHLLQEQGDLAGARPLFERALAIYEKVLGPEHTDTNRVRYTLSYLLIALGSPTQALALAETALNSNEKLLGPDHKLTKDSAHVTAHALNAVGRVEEAKALRERYGLTRTDSPMCP